MASLETFITVFQVKTFNEVLTQLDLKPVKVHAVHPPEALKSQMQEKIRVLGRVPTPAEVDADPRMASTATFYRAFCGDKWRWNVVLEACGSEGNIRGDYTRSKLEAQLRRKTKSLGRSPSIPDVRADPGMASPDTFMRIFGVKTWNDVLRAMGLQVNMKRYTTAMLTAQLLGKVQELGRTPTSNEVNADPNMATVNAFKRAFGMDWAGIIQLHGLTSYQQKYS